MDRKIIRSTGIGMMISALFIYSAAYFTDEQTHEVQNAVAEDEMVIKTDEYQSLQNEIVAWEERFSALETETEKPAEDITRMILSIESGMTSPDISSALYSNGLITDEAIFNQYLADQNLTDQIQIGEYDLNSTMSIEQIAKLITQ